MAKYLGREYILNVVDECFEDVFIPEWKGTVKVRSLTGAQRAVLLNQAGDVDAAEWIERLVASCVCDENGNPLFTHKDVEKLSQKNASALNRIFEVADRLNGFSEKAIDEIAGE